jgi:hypothetical protein
MQSFAALAAAKSEDPHACKSATGARMKYSMHGSALGTRLPEVYGAVHRESRGDYGRVVPGPFLGFPLSGDEEAWRRGGCHSRF